MPGIADLPLHGGKVPYWMLRYMEGMAEKIVDAIIELYGPKALLKGLSDPLWFQAFNNVIGMDWDSSGSTTVVTSILKKISWRKPELGILVLGGKGKNMRNVPSEAEKAEKILDVSSELVKSFSKKTAKIDSSFLIDGYELYLHSVILVEKNQLLTIQQGMNTKEMMARRYHLDKTLLFNPHTGIAGEITTVINYTDRKSEEALKTIKDVLQEGPEKIKRDYYEARRLITKEKTITEYIGEKDVRTEIPRELLIHYKPLLPDKKVVKKIEKLAKNPPTEIQGFLDSKNTDGKVMRALALISHLIYRVEVSTKDPVTHPINPFVYSYSVGGKDRIPYPFNPKTAKQTILILEEALQEARLGKKEKLQGIMRLRKLVDNIIEK